ncbi:hypothetical protein PTKU64_80300 [Paraburkholderia terrae]|uniref:DUF2169 domain-containing protein n=1 Tax=Paraburkholderia terrae TaxID=311230 RepID=A0ABM7TZ39_9BURK|nr:hypothetical protein [Paraburkholderia terrae]BCZ84355.1 hypothetical protein PTKU64_80300 [Paraburkholderia terrae]
MSGYLERIASLALGVGPRLRPLPRYRFEDSQTWAPGDANRPWLENGQTAERTASFAARDDEPDLRHAVRGIARVKAPPFDDQRVPVRTVLAQGTHASVPDGPDGLLLALQPDAGPAAETSSQQPTQAAHVDREPLVPALADPDVRDVHPRIEADHGPLHHGEPRSLRQNVREAGRERLRQSGRHAAEADGPPTVIVRIGHIDVRAVNASTPAAPPREPEPERALRKPSLDTYLKTRDRGRP